MSFEIFIKIENSEDVGDERWYIVAVRPSPEVARRLVEEDITDALARIGLTVEQLDD